MGGVDGYARPVQPVDGRISSWRAHTNRGVPSVEPGTDYYVPIGTPVRAADSGRIVDVGDSIYPATGRYVTIDLDDGRRVRYLHLRNRIVKVGDRVQWGQVIGYSGASGYGEEDWSWNVAETGGAHVHMTLWAHQEYKFGRYATLDPEIYMSSNQGGNNSTPGSEDEEDEMPDSMFAVVDGVPSWCWINWAKGTVYSVHTQSDADWVGSYMGSVKKNFSKDDDGGTDRYKNTLALLKLLNP